MKTTSTNTEHKPGKQSWLGQMILLPDVTCGMGFRLHNYHLYNTCYTSARFDNAEWKSI
jgi:hypothetical protein